MAIEIQKRFRVDAPVERVWGFLNDLERVAKCLRGARITGRDEGGAWTGTMKVKLGPVSSTYEGTVRFVDVDESARRAELSAEGQDTRGKGAADMTMRSQLEPDAGGTAVNVSSTVNVTGVLARMGRGMIEDVSEQLFERFVACAREALEAPEGAEEAEVDVADGAESSSPETPGTTKAVGEPDRRSTPPPHGGPDDEVEALQLGGLGARAVLRRPLFWVVLALVLLAVWTVLG